MTYEDYKKIYDSKMGTVEDALAMIAAGADRIGASASIAICTE